MTYLIWSNEHRAWWGPDFCGYKRQLSEAGRYSREDAISISKNAIPGVAGTVLPELPVLLDDVREMQTAHHRTFGPMPPEPWE